MEQDKENYRQPQKDRQENWNRIVLIFAFCNYPSDKSYDACGKDNRRDHIPPMIVKTKYPQDLNKKYWSNDYDQEKDM